MRKSTWVYLLAFIINCCLMSKYDEKYDSLEPDIIFLKQDERGEEQPGGVWQHSLSIGQLAKGQKTLSPPALLQKVPSAN